jgi:hypothetical protein
VALGLDQGANGDAWGYDIGAQRVTLTAAALGWPHYFVDLSGVGGSADPAGDLVVIAACTKLAPSSPVSATPSATAISSSTASPTGSASTTASPSGTASPSASASGSPASPPAQTSQGCLHPELVALNL